MDITERVEAVKTKHARARARARGRAHDRMACYAYLAYARREGRWVVPPTRLSDAPADWVAWANEIDDDAALDYVAEYVALCDE